MSAGTETLRSSGDWLLFRRLLKESRPYAGHLTVILLLSLSAAPLALLLPIPLQVVVDSVIGTAPVPAFLRPLFPGGSSPAPEPLLIVCAALLVLLTLLQHLEGFASWLLQLYTGERLVLGFRGRLFEHVQRLSLLYHDRAGTADSVYRIQHDAPAVQYVIVSGVIPLVTSAVTVLAMIYVISRISMPLALVAALVAPVLWVLTEWYRRRIRGRWTRVKEQESLAMGVVQEVLSSLRVVKAFGQEERERDRFTAASAQVLRSHLRVVSAEAAFGLAVAATLAGGTATILYLGVHAQRSGNITLGQLLLVIAYLAQLYRPLENVSRTVAALQSSIAGAERAFALLDHAPDVPERPDARPLQRARGRVIFEHVSFTYDGERPILTDVCLDIAAGSQVGILGHTGAGKTTLVNLIARFHDPSGGAILLDGVDLREYRLRDLRAQFSVVLQEPVLFSTSIAENIGYGRADATRGEIVAAAVAAHAHDFISGMPAGYDSVLGERGMTLSGGERQRIALARAFLKSAPILILDEPTSSVDLASEAAIMEATGRLMHGRTTFLITHRLKTVEHCDVLVRVEGGRVVGAPTASPSGGHPASQALPA